MQMHDLLIYLVRSIVEPYSSSTGNKNMDQTIYMCWQKNIQSLKSSKSWYELGISYESIGHLKIGLAPTQNKLSYWNLATISVFEGFAFLLKASKYYQFAKKQPESHLVAQRLFLILKDLVNSHNLDEQILVGLIWELMGDCSLLLGNTSGISYYNTAKNFYDLEVNKDESAYSTWEVQEEFELVNLVIAEDSAQLEERTFDSYKVRLDKKIALLKK